VVKKPYVSEEQMTSDVQQLQKLVADRTRRAARYLIWHDNAKAFPKPVDGATCFFLRFEHGIIGVTANHVIGHYEAAVAANPTMVCQLGHARPAFDILSAIIARDHARDIASFSVPEMLLRQLDAEPIDCQSNWPPPEPKRGETVSACGFPVSTRTTWADRTGEFGVWAAIAVIEDVSRDKILLTYDSATDQPLAFAPMPPLGMNISGCSGGPVLLHREQRGLIRWFPVALIVGGPRAKEKQGASTEFDQIFATRIDCIRPDGSIAQPVDTGWLPS
jgi:hypothetical protein